MGNRQRGDYFERQAKVCLITHGWWVIRAAGSQGAADLVALRAGQKPLAVSCKLDGRLRPAERDELLMVARMSGAAPIIASRRIRGHVLLEMLDRDGTTRHWVDEIHVPPSIRY